VVPEGAKEFFVVSTGASATLIGLLFVAIAVEPTSIVGEESPVETRSRASSAFIALLNVFFISLAGTVPPTNVGGRRGHPRRSRHSRHLGHRPKPIGGVVYYPSGQVQRLVDGGEPHHLCAGGLVRLAGQLGAGNSEALYGLVYVLFVVYGVALGGPGSCWERETKASSGASSGTSTC